MHIQATTALVSIKDVSKSMFYIISQAALSRRGTFGRSLAHLGCFLPAAERLIQTSCRNPATEGSTVTSQSSRLVIRTGFGFLREGNAISNSCYLVCRNYSITAATSPTAATKIPGALESAPAVTGVGATPVGTAPEGATSVAGTPVGSF